LYGGGERGTWRGDRVRPTVDVDFGKLAGQDAIRIIFA
jgi:hypothetical protein